VSHEDQNHITKVSDKPKEGAEKSALSFVSNFRLLWKVALAGLFLVTASIIIPVGVVNHPLTHRTFLHLLDLAGKLGDAFLIASVLVLAIDDDARLKLIETVVRAASPKLIGRHLPESVQNTVLRYFKIDFFRPTFSVDYEFIVTGNAVEIITRVCGSLRNCSPNAEVFDFSCSVDPSVLDIAIGEPRIISARVENSEGTIVLHRQFNEKAIRQFSEPVSLSPGAEYHTFFESIEYRPLTYFLPLILGTTVVTATVQIRYPKDDFDMELQLPNMSGNNPKPALIHSGAEWTLRNPILPGQCVLVTWNPKKVKNIKGLPSGPPASPTPSGPPAITSGEPTPTPSASPTSR
jgi:hypothetical protein